MDGETKIFASQAQICLIDVADFLSKKNEKRGRKSCKFSSKQPKAVSFFLITCQQSKTFSTFLQNHLQNVNLITPTYYYY